MDRFRTTVLVPYDGSASADEALLLACHLAGSAATKVILLHVNVIPLNPTTGSKWDASPKPVEREFVRLVNAGGVACTVRDTRGQDIAAACGQLAAEG